MLSSFGRRTIPPFPLLSQMGVFRVIFSLLLFRWSLYFLLPWFRPLLRFKTSPFCLVIMSYCVLPPHFHRGRFLTRRRRFSLFIGAEVRGLCWFPPPLVFPFGPSYLFILPENYNAFFGHPPPQFFFPVHVFRFFFPLQE